VLLHLIDGAADEPLEAWRVVRGELESYGAGLADKPEIIALTKSDLLDEKRRKKLLAALAKETRAPLFPVSAPLGEGMEALLDALIQRLGGIAETPSEEERAERDWSPL
jgi:GTP-binding protein